MLSKQLPVAFDIEGPLIPPSIDFAKLIMEKLVSKPVREKFNDPVTVKFDALDDAAWLYWRAMCGHSTGMMPSVVMCVAGVDGLTDDDLISYSQKCYKLNPGTKELIEYLQEKNVEIYLVTSSYSAIPLTLAQEFDIPSSHVFTLGHQLDKKTLAEFDKNRDLVKEVKARSPLDMLNKHGAYVEKFLDRYLPFCADAVDVYERGVREEVIQLEVEYKKVFYDRDARIDITNLLRDLLIDETGVMGGHKKKDVLHRIDPRGNVLLIADSIVDADATEFSNFGITVNCTDQYALLASNVNVVTKNMVDLITIIDNFVFERKEFILPVGVEWYSSDEIQTELKDIKNKNRVAKDYMKSLFIPPDP